MLFLGPFRFGTLLDPRNSDTSGLGLFQIGEIRTLSERCFESLPDWDLSGLVKWEPLRIYEVGTLPGW